MSIFLHQAIRSLNENAIEIDGYEIESVEAKDVNGNLIKIDANSVVLKMNTLQTIETAKQEAEIASKESALKKLTALGLTQDEIKALVG